ncbi:hypothetical protein D6817_03615, partial [Candidatus Pacearchaeota archaeon]
VRSPPSAARKHGAPLKPQHRDAFLEQPSALYSSTKTRISCARFNNPILPAFFRKGISHKLFILRLR